MKKIKKIMAMLVAMVMVLGMTVTASAAPEDNAKIIINNLDDQAKVKVTQVIAPNPKKETGWEFTNNALTAYQSQDAFNQMEEQKILKQLINYQALIENPQLQEANYPYKDAGIATAQQIATALVAFNKNVTPSEAYPKDGVKVTSAGVYAIKVTTTQTNPLIVYSDMAAYVKFGQYDTATGVPGNLQDAVVNAKKTENKVEKTHEAGDNVVAIGDKVEYTIKTTIPYFKDHETNIVYKISDTIKGAKYESDDGKNVKLTTVTLNGQSNVINVTAPITQTNDGETFTIDLSKIAAEKNEDGSRKYANQELVIKYNAIVTGNTVNNRVTVNRGEETDSTTDSDDVYTGTVTMTKTGEDKKPLKDAGFAVYRKKTTQDGEVKEYAKVTLDQTTKAYTVTGWETVEEFTDENRNQFMVITDEKGQAVVKGLDSDDSYWFKEIQAPKGYSINETDSQVSWNKVTDVTNVTGSASMTDTKLSSLPSTGGIGTTIFTIGGCAIMIIAAAMFFASRRKEYK